MKKNKNIIAFLLCSFFVLRLSSQNIVGKQSSLSEEELNLVKGYFTCQCINYALKKQAVKYDDGSSYSYVDKIDFYDMESINKIENYSKDFVEHNINYGKKGKDNFIIRKCIDHQKSEELKKFINSLKKDKRPRY